MLAEKLRNPPSDDFRVLVLLPARANDGADISRGQVAALIHAADETTRFLACTIYARSRNLRDPVYVHSKIGIVDDRWLTVGSANLNAHSLFNDTEMNVATLDPDARSGSAASPVVGAPRASARGRPGRPDRADRRALGAHLVGAARAPRRERGAHASTGEAAGRVAATPAPARPAAEPALRRLTRSLTGAGSTPRSSAISAASSTGAPRTRKRPPNAIAQMPNHAQPKASPAMTSDIQWTPRSTRLQATADGDRDRAAGEKRARPRRAPAREHECRSRVERRRKARVAARERRARASRRSRRSRGARDRGSP